MRIFLLLVAALALVFGVKFIFDARPIAKKYFSFQDKNNATVLLKILGAILIALGTVLVCVAY